MRETRMKWALLAFQRDMKAAEMMRPSESGH